MKKSVVCRSITELTFALLLSFSAGSVSAASHVKATAHNKISQVSSPAPGTRLIATGAIDLATSSVKAISANNRFTWVRVQSTTIVVQAGRRLGPESISEGDKLLCQGAWVDDAWGPVFQAKRVEIIGRIGDVGMQEKVAAACQSVADSGSRRSGGSGELSFGKVNTDNLVNRQAQELQDYQTSLQERSDAVDQAKTKLMDQVEKAGTLGYDRQFEADFNQAKGDYDAALDSLTNIRPVPPAMSRANSLARQGVSSYRQESSLWARFYRAIALGQDDQILVKRRIKLFDEGTRLIDAAISESKKVVGASP